MGYIYIGKLTSTHGLKGELKLKSSFLYIDRVMKSGFSFYIGDDKKCVKLLKHRVHNGLYLLTFKDYEDINLVEDFRNKELYVLREDIKLCEGEALFEDYIGLDAFYEDRLLGKVIDITDCGNKNYIFYIVGDKEVLIPVNDRFIKQVIIGDKIVFKDVEGLLDAN